MRISRLRISETQAHVISFQKKKKKATRGFVICCLFFRKLIAVYRTENVNMT